MGFELKLKHFVGASVLATSLALASTSAQAAFADFTIDEGSVTGVPGTITADKLNGGYSERITFGAGTFTTFGFADWGQFFANEGVTLVNSQLNTNYAMYALFSADGSFQNVPATPPFFPGGTAFQATSASFFLWIDPNQDTDKSLGGGGVTLANTGDDFLIASADSLTEGSGFLTAGVGGFFDLRFDDFALTPAGEAYFIAPDPFYLRVNVDGDFDEFTPVGTIDVTGDISAVFEQNVPEPSTIALLGFGLLALGIGLGRRRV